MTPSELLMIKLIIPLNPEHDILTRLIPHIGLVRFFYFMYNLKFLLNRDFLGQLYN